MPELPEVETVVRDLRACGLVGLQIMSAHVFWPRSVAAPAPTRLPAAIRGNQILGLSRRGKFIRVDLSGKADLPLLSVLQSIREHIATLVFPGFIGKTPPEALPSIERYLHADLLRLAKAKNDKNRDVRWAWEADEAKQLADNTMAKAQREPAGPRHETLMKQAETLRWMLEEFYVSLWAQELGTPKPISLQRIKKAIA